MRNQINTFIHFTIVCVVFSTVCAQLVNRRCSFPKTRNTGICKPLRECQSAIEQKRYTQVICFYNYNDPYVCCEDESTSGNNAWESPLVFPDSGESPSNLRTSEQKCREYSRSLVQTVEAIPLVTNPEPIAVDVPKCDYNSIPLIVGGSPAEPGEFPHMALIGYRVEKKIGWHCGGTLISDQFVLTAAHCATTRNGRPVQVRLGELNLARRDDGSRPQDFNIADVIPYPGYKSPNKYHDIALIRLADTVHFNRFMRPACLWTDFKINQNKTIATGWGHTAYAGPSSDTLQKVALDIIDNDECRRHYDSDMSRYLPNGIQPTMLCAGDLRGGKDTCQGDSGGPIQITSHENQCLFYIIGITSFGKGCASSTPAIYTRVSQYVGWIERIVWP